jgi:hypothetical protein
MTFKILLVLAALFAITFAASPCTPGYQEIEDCMEYAIDPSDGNCWWAADTGSCLEIYADSETQCADYCSSCLSCVWDFGCCTEGNAQNYKTCYSGCVANL